LKRDGNALGPAIEIVSPSQRAHARAAFSRVSQSFDISRVL
jgi:hypothetical protein